MKFINIGIFCSLYKHFLKLTFLWRFKKIVSNLGFKCQSSTRNRKKFLISFLKKFFFYYEGSTFEAFRVIILEIVKGGGQDVALKLLLFFYRYLLCDISFVAVYFDREIDFLYTLTYTVVASYSTSFSFTGFLSSINIHAWSVGLDRISDNRIIVEF